MKVMNDIYKYKNLYGIPLGSELRGQFYNIDFT